MEEDVADLFIDPKSKMLVLYIKASNNAFYLTLGEEISPEKLERFKKLCEINFTRLEVS